MENESGSEPLPPLAPLYAALAKAQGEYQPIERTRTVTVRPKKKDDGYQPPPYTFDYAPLEEVLRKCRPALNANGLSLFHRLDMKAGCVRTILAHSSGAKIEDECPIGKSDWQGMGSAITYARRYSVQCLLGVAAEFDDDGNEADGNEIEEIKLRGAQKAQAQQAAPPRQQATRTQKTPPASLPAQDKPIVETKSEPEPEKPANGNAPVTQSQSDAGDLDLTNLIHRYRGDLPFDGHVDDKHPLAKGGATSAVLRHMMTAAKIRDVPEIIEYVKTHTGVEPQLITYGQTRALIAKMWSEGVRI